MKKKFGYTYLCVNIYKLSALWALSSFLSCGTFLPIGSSLDKSTLEILIKWTCWPSYNWYLSFLHLSTRRLLTGQPSSLYEGSYRDTELSSTDYMSRRFNLLLIPYILGLKDKKNLLHSCWHLGSTRETKCLLFYSSFAPLSGLNLCCPHPWLTHVGLLFIIPCHFSDYYWPTNNLPKLLPTISNEHSIINRTNITKDYKIFQEPLPHPEKQTVY